MSPKLLRRLEDDFWVARIRFIEITPDGVSQRVGVVRLTREQTQVLKAVGPMVYEVTGEAFIDRRGSLNEELWVLELDPFDLTPIKILHLLYPYLIREEDSQRRIITRSVKADLVYGIISELRSFLPNKSTLALKSNYREAERLSKVERRGDYLYLHFVNPSYLLTLIRYHKLNNLHGAHARDVLSENRILEKVMSIEYNDSFLIRHYEAPFTFYSKQRREIFRCLREFTMLRRELYE